METLIQDPYQQDESSLGSSSMDKTEPFYDSTNSIAAVSRSLLIMLLALTY